MRHFMRYSKRLKHEGKMITGNSSDTHHAQECQGEKGMTINDPYHEEENGNSSKNKIQQANDASVSNESDLSLICLPSCMQEMGHPGRPCDARGCRLVP